MYLCVCVWCVRFYFGCASMCASINNRNNENNNNNSGNKRQKTKEAKKLKMKYQQHKMTGWLTCRNFKNKKKHENLTLSGKRLRLSQIQKPQLPLFIKKRQRIAVETHSNRPKVALSVSWTSEFNSNSKWYICRSFSINRSFSYIYSPLLLVYLD